MPKGGIVTRPHTEILTFEEIVRLVRILVSSGISKIRLTGGEPLVRSGIVNLVKFLNLIEGIEEVSLTTNGTLLSLYADRLKKAGLKRINISLDTLRQDRFRQITRNNSFYRVLEGISAAKESGFDSLKLNVVVMKGINDDEIIDFVEFALKRGLILRFIEFMNVTPLWKEECFIPIDEVKRICEKRFGLTRIVTSGSGPAVYYRVEKDGFLGFINTNEYNCRRCSRLRLTSTGEFKICLYETQGFSLGNLLRQGCGDEEINNTIRAKLELKKYISYEDEKTSRLYMCNVGG
jgi:cyclic pyranopterin phosphate synthase